MDESHLPIDRGWAWVVLLALFVLSAGPHCMANRWFVLIGCVFGVAAYMVCAFAPNVDLVMMSQGAAVGMAHGPTLVMVGKYFNKKRGLANSLANIGAGIGGLIFPPLIRFMLDFYGLRGTLMIISGVMFNISIIAALLRPLEFYSKRRKSKVKMNSEKCLKNGELSNQEALLPEKNIKKEALEGNSFESEKYYISQGAPKGTIHLSYELLVSSKNGRLRTQSTSSGVLRTSYKKSETGSTRSINKYITEMSNTNSSLFQSVEALGSIPDFKNDDNNSETLKTCSISAGSILKKLFDFKALKSRRFNLFMLTGFIAISGNAFVVLYLPAHAKDIGITDTKAALLVSIVQATDIVSRVFMAFILDRRILERHQMLSIALIITGISCQLLPIFTQFWSLTLFSVIYGFFGGLYFAIYPVIIVDFVGIECLSSGMAIMMLLHGVSLSFLAPILGMLRDRTGSYLASYHLMGTGSIIGSLLLFLEPLVRRFEKKSNIVLHIKDNKANNKENT
ncbi:hypothetical protein KUTeg_012379 [Tegillarca granosa]|uniref:Major facilitator superfamily (MFS) profile domain-containing protein n=1 Tax=Tegillarca granosa TaxID=220873 RepID=A0ABQ9EZK0_TEGGR|nr:hypothetical protein KUTeg_012379 [Tegillarca granosa]